jgi:hypothetical protein
MTTPPPPKGSKSAGGKKIFGLPRIYVYGGAIAIIAGIAFYLYKEHKASSAASSTTEGSPCTASDGTTGTYDANGNCVSSDSGDTGTDDSGDLSAVQTELESLLADQGTTSTSSTSGTVTVPDVEGGTIDAATAKLKAAGLKGHIPQTLANGTSYIVNSQTPGAGQKVASGATVDLGVKIASPSAAGSGTVKVPSVEGKSIAAAEAAIKSAGLTYKLSNSANLKRGTTYVITSQTPAAGASVARGSNVDLGAGTRK